LTDFHRATKDVVDRVGNKTFQQLVEEGRTTVSLKEFVADMLVEYDDLAIAVNHGHEATTVTLVMITHRGIQITTNFFTNSVGVQIQSLDYH
jgi:hypothetical protein